VKQNGATMGGHEWGTNPYCLYYQLPANCDLIAGFLPKPSDYNNNFNEWWNKCFFSPNLPTEPLQ
jgi:hypothetical protein